MESLVGYGSDDEVETERFGGHQASASGAARRRDDDTNYDDVNMDMSEESQQAESEPELPPAEPAPAPDYSRHARRGSDDSRHRSREQRRETPPRDRRESPPRGRRESPPRGRPESPPRRRLESPPRSRHDRREPRRDDRYRSDRGDRGERGEKGDRVERGEKSDRSRGYDSSRRGLLGDRPEDNPAESKPPALMELKPFGGDAPPGYEHKRSQDARDPVSPRFVDRERRDRDRDRERDRDRHGRQSEERRSRTYVRHGEPRSRSRSRGAVYPPQHHASTSSSSERRGSPPSGDYRPSSYKVNRKLDVMEKMGLQIKTPDGSMATAQQLRAAAGDAPRGGQPSYFNPGAGTANKILDQVQKRKLLWSHKGKSEAEEAAKWSGTRFAQDNDGRQVSKFMRLMGIKEPAAITSESADKAVDPIKKQEELFQAMQAQYEVARATTHTMRGVGLGFQRGQF